MSDKKFYNNKVLILGKVESEFTYHHRAFEENFYEVIIAVKRLSDNIDYLPVVVSERLVDVKQNMIGSIVRVHGSYRSYNQHTHNSKSKLLLYVLAKELDVLEKEEEEIDLDSCNQIYLKGYLCRKPIYRETPLGKQITDLLIAVNRSYGKSDYIPCICWGADAQYASNYEVGTKIELEGRIQSREYFKKLPNEDVSVRKIAYEVSCKNIDRKIAGKSFFNHSLLFTK